MATVPEWFQKKNRSASKCSDAPADEGLPMPSWTGQKNVDLPAPRVKSRAGRMAAVEEADRYRRIGRNEERPGRGNSRRLVESGLDFIRRQPLGRLSLHRPRPHRFPPARASHFHKPRRDETRIAAPPVAYFFAFFFPAARNGHSADSVRAVRK